MLFYLISSYDFPIIPIVPRGSLLNEIFVDHFKLLVLCCCESMDAIYFDINRCIRVCAPELLQ